MEKPVVFSKHLANCILAIAILDDDTETYSKSRSGQTMVDSTKPSRNLCLAAKSKVGLNLNLSYVCIRLIDSRLIKKFVREVSLVKKITQSIKILNGQQVDILRDQRY